MEEHDAQEHLEASVNPRLSGKDVSVEGITHWLQNPDSCDKILFRDGKEVAARVTEISPAEIRYRKCDMPDGPLFVSRKADIFMIRYANGKRETFEPEKPVAPPAKSVPGPGYHRYSNPANLHSDASLSLILGILGLVTFIYGSIHAIVLGSRVLNYIKANPGNYEGEAMARAGLILGIIKLAILFLYFILIVIGLSMFI
jgi:hypothetical protein